MAPAVTAPTAPPTAVTAAVIPPQGAVVPAAAAPTTAPTGELALILQTLVTGMDKKEKLTLPQLKKASKASYNPWKEETLIALELQPSFQRYIDSDINKY